MGLLGLLLAYLALPLLTSLNAGNIPRVEEITHQPGGAAFYSARSVLTGLIFGIVPAFQSSRVPTDGNLKEGKKGRRAGIRYRRSLDALVVSEIALALVLDGRRV